jgi:hypothetical protein
MRRLSGAMGNNEGIAIEASLIREAEPGMYLAAEQTHNGQPEVNVARTSATKTVFSRQHSPRK